MSVEKGDEELLEVVLGDAGRLAPGEDRPHRSDPAAAAMALQQPRHRGPAGQLPHLRLVESPFQRPLGNHSRQVEDGPRDGGDRNTGGLLDFVRQQPRLTEQNRALPRPARRVAAHFNPFRVVGEDTP